MFSSLSHHAVALRKLLASALLLACAASAQAAVVTIDEVGLDRIYAQAHIDVRVDATTVIHNSALLNMDYSEFLSTIRPKSKGAIPIYFIDAFVPDNVYITSSTIGLGWIGAGGLAVVSSWAADPQYGASLLAHELGHNLGLQHDYSSLNDLMYPVIMANSPDNFLAYQLNIISGSSLLQTDRNGQLYIEIAPVLIAATLAPVPEPASSAMLLAGLGLLGVVWRRRKSYSRLV